MWCITTRSHSFLYEKEVFPTISCLVLIYSTLRNIKRCVIECVLSESSRIRCLSCYRKRILYQRNDSWNIRSIERIISNARHAVADRDRGEARATRERFQSNARHTVGDGDGGEARAIIERITSNARHTVGDGDGGKARAARERIVSNARHAVGDGDRGKARATMERLSSNARHTVGDGDGGEARAPLEYIKQ